MIIAIDTGGTKTLITRFEADGTKQTLVKFPTPHDKPAYLEAVVANINEHVGSEPIDVISVAMPGPIRDGILLRTPNIGWSNFDVVSELGEYFPDVKILLENDAALAGLAEARELTPSGLCVYVTLSTGVGTGIAYDGRFLPELDRFEGGSIRIEYEGEVQRWEHIASGKKFYERYGMYGSDVTDPAIWHDYAERVAAGFQVLIPLLEPDHLVIGGSMGTHYAKYSAQLQAMLDARIAKHMEHTTISQAVHPEEAVIYGCYYYAIDALAR